MTIYGVDVSHHQGTVDWGKVAADGITFAILKATEGTGFVDDQFRRNIDGAREAGLTAGAYHFLQPGNGATQAAAFLACLGPRTADLLLVVDVETTGNGGHPSAGDAAAFVAAVRRKLGPDRPIGVYTGRWYWSGILGDPALPPRTWLWESRYVTGVGPWRTLAKKTPAGWFDEARAGGTTPTIVQYSSAGNVAGIGSCDVNAYPHTRGDLLRLTGTADQEGTMSAEDVKAINAHTDEQRAHLEQVIDQLAQLVAGGTNARYNRKTLPGAVLASDLQTQANTTAAAVGDTRKAVLALATAVPPGSLSDADMRRLADTVAGAVSGVHADEVLDALARRLGDADVKESK